MCGRSTLWPRTGRLRHVPVTDSAERLPSGGSAATEDIRAPESEISPGIWGAVAGCVPPWQEGISWEKSACRHQNRRLGHPASPRGKPRRAIHVEARGAALPARLASSRSWQEPALKGAPGPEHVSDSQGSSPWIGTCRKQTPTWEVWAGQEAETVKRGHVPFSFFKIEL